ncbi:hypothetical protein V1515DRAFT_444636 [Lipomyces mesembrius]
MTKAAPMAMASRTFGAVQARTLWGNVAQAQGLTPAQNIFRVRLPPRTGLTSRRTLSRSHIMPSESDHETFPLLVFGRRKQRRVLLATHHDDNNAWHHPRLGCVPAETCRHVGVVPMHGRMLVRLRWRCSRPHKWTGALNTAALGHLHPHCQLDIRQPPYSPLVLYPVACPRTIFSLKVSKFQIFVVTRGTAVLSVFHTNL